MAAISLGLALAVPPPGAAAKGEAVAKGLAVEFTLATPDGSKTPMEGQQATFRFKISNADSGKPLTGVSPAAWLARKDAPSSGAGRTPARSNVQKAAPFLRGGDVLRPPEIDLNSFRVVVMNEEATLSVLDPLLHLSGSRLQTLVQLPSPAADWVQTADQRTIFVTMSGANALAAIDTESWKIAHLVEGIPGAGKVLLQPDQGYVWATYSDPGAQKGGVAIFRTDTLQRVATIETGAGPYTVAFRPDSRYAFVASAGSGTVSVVDIPTLVKIKELRTGQRPTGLAFSTAGNTLYVSDPLDGTVNCIDGTLLEIAGRIDAGAGVGEIAFAPEGRYGFLLNPSAGRIQVLDASVKRVIQTGVTAAPAKPGKPSSSEPFQVFFSARFAYVLDRRGDSVLMAPLEQIGEEGKPLTLAEVPAGHEAIDPGSDENPPRMLVESAEPGSVLFVNPADGVVYYYQEGMTAAMGSFDNYRRKPRAVLVVNHSLRETSPGVYETTARLDRPGKYEVVFSLNSPSLVQVFDLEIGANPEIESKRQNPLAEVRRLPSDGSFVAGQKATLRFGLTLPAQATPLDGVSDLLVLLQHTGSNWERRKVAAGVGNGIYEIEFLPASAGSYRVSFASTSLLLPFRATPAFYVQVQPAP